MLRKAAIPLAIFIVLAPSAWSQTAPVPTPLPRPAKAQVPAPRGIAPVSQSANPTYDEGTYQRISSAMLSYSGIEVRGGWPSLPAKARLEPGATGPDVALLRQRLSITDDLAHEKAQGEVYDEAVTEAVRSLPRKRRGPERSSL